MTTLRGSTSDFPLESLIGLLAGTSKTGELQVRSNDRVGALGFASGRLVAAVMDDEGGENALGAIFAIHEADFEFTPWASPPDANLEAGDLVSLLKRAAEARDRLAAIREQIPDDRMRFRLSEKAADQGAVTFTPERWRALLAVNGERDVTAIAEQLRVGRMDTLTLLAGLVRDGVIETIAPPSGFAPSRNAPPAEAPAPEAPAEDTTRAQQEWPEEQHGAAAPGAAEWNAPAEPPVAERPAAPDWGAAEAAAEEPVPEPAAPPEWRDTFAPEPASTSEPPREQRVPPPSPAETREDLDAQIAERFGSFTTTPEPRRPDVPPAVDDRLSTLTGIFAPGPAANAPAEVPASEPPAPQPQPTDTWAQGTPAPSRPADSWMTAPPAASETPANTWAPGTPPESAEGTDAWPRSATAPEAPAAPAKPAAAEQWTAPAADAQAEKKRGGLFGMFRREEPTPIARMPAADATTSRPGMLASFSNALLMEYNSGVYGKAKIESRMANLLMRVDEQADPIDRPLPIVDDLIDATSLERERFPEEQVTPYLATLVRQIYEDAERAFGKDKAKKGYRTAQQAVFKNDQSLFQSPDLAAKLPKG